MDPVAEGTATKYLRGPSGQSVHGIIRGGMTIAGADRHGDVSFTLSTAGTVVDSKVSDPFGKPLGMSGSSPNIGFQSDWTDPTNGLVWMGARWYNPNTGTFTARDIMPGSVGAYATMNRYTYGLNNPLTYSDPTGRVAAPANCDNACHYAHLQSTGELYDDPANSHNDRHQRGDLDASVEVYEGEDGPTFIVSWDSGIVVSTTADTRRSLKDVELPSQAVSPTGSVNRSNRTGFDALEDEASNFRQMIQLAAFNAANGTPSTTTAPPTTTHAQCVKDNNDDPANAGSYTTAKKCGYTTPTDGAKQAAMNLLRELKNGTEAFGYWWKKHGNKVVTAMAVVGFVVCVASTAGACAAVAYATAAVTTAGNLSLYAIGEKSGSRTIAAIATDIVLAKFIPGTASAGAKFDAKFLNSVAVAMIDNTSFRNATLSAGYAMARFGVQGIAASGQLIVAARTLICTWEQQNAKNPACT
jgi:RHS repeat-associated protein